MKPSETPEHGRPPYAQLLDELKEWIGEAEVANAERFLEDLLERVAKKRLTVGTTTILIGYGGGKDSSWVVAFLRLVQLLCLESQGSTFKLRIVTMVHLGMPPAVLQNIDAVYRKLQLYGDAKATLKIFCYGHKSTFRKDYAIPKSARNMLRKDILLAGHRSRGNPRGTFCISCNLHTINAGLAYIDEKTDFLLTGDSPKELALYWRWLLDVFRKVGIRGSGAGNPFSAAIDQLCRLNYKFYRDLLPESDDSIIKRLPPAIANDDIETSMLSIFGFTDYDCGSHWGFLTEYLGFQFSPEALNFTESDCRHPMLMAHLRGLTAELEGRTYAAGIREYLELTDHLMRKKQFPEALIEAMHRRYGSDEKIAEMRATANGYAWKILDATEGQLACLIQSPFTDKAQRLRQFLQERHPTLAGKADQLESVLQGQAADLETARLLKDLSGLDVQDLQKLYASVSVPRYLGGQKQGDFSGNLFKIFLNADPHKKEITYSRNGKEVKEVVFGR